MVIQNSILAGRILSFLETEQRSMTVNELAYYLEEKHEYIQCAVERLVREGLAVLDVDYGLVKIEKIPEFVQDIPKPLNKQKHRTLAYA